MNAIDTSSRYAAVRGALMFGASRLGIGAADTMFAPVNTGI